MSLDSKSVSLMLHESSVGGFEDAEALPEILAADRQKYDRFLGRCHCRQCSGSKERKGTCLGVSYWKVHNSRKLGVSMSTVAQAQAQLQKNLVCLCLDREG